jgi:DNA polymerase-1
MKPLHTAQGEPVQAVYGFCRMVKKLIDSYNPCKLVIAWDSKGKTVRHEIYDQYKQNRQAPPSDLFEQKKQIQAFADIVGIQQINKEGVEADDLMYSLACNVAQEEKYAVIVTSDKDMAQMLGDHAYILDPFKNTIITQQDIEASFGFPLERLPMYYALVGDSSDNIPGAKGIGPKGAQKVVSAYASLDDIFDHIDEIKPPRLQKLLQESHDAIYMSYDLFILRYYDVGLSFECCDFVSDGWNNAYEFFHERGFKSLLKTIDASAQKSIIKQEEDLPLSSDVYTYTCITDVSTLKKVIKEITDAGFCALDTETNCLNPLQSTVVGVSICCEKGKAYYIPFGHQTGEKQISRDDIVTHLKPLLEDESISKCLHHAKYDALALHTLSINLKGIVFDTMIAAHLCVPDGQKIGLKALSESMLSQKMETFRFMMKSNGCTDFSFIPLTHATSYAAADAHQTFQLYHIFKNTLEKESLADIFYHIEMPLVSVLIDMEKYGMLVDASLLDQIDTRITAELHDIHTELIDLAGPDYKDINVNSSRQLADLLFNHLELEPVKKTAQKTGYSTDNEVLKVLAKTHKVPLLIIKYRELFKLKTTYIDGLIQHIDKRTSRIHTSMRQTAVATGRLSSSEPNLQNIPLKAFGIRSAFIVPDDSLMLSADYSQIELRVLAYLSQDDYLLKAFSENMDIHALTASGLFSKDVHDITGDERQVGKRINFSILYGLTAHGLSKDLEITHKKAQLYIDTYFEQYPGVQKWMDDVIVRAQERGYVETLNGRRRYLPGLREKNQTLFKLARRAAINTVGQGTAAEIVKKGMIDLHNRISSSYDQTHIILQIHDELLLQVHRDDVDAIKLLVASTLENVVSWNVPLVVTTRTGRNWQEVTK